MQPPPRKVIVVINFERFYQGLVKLGFLDLDVRFF